MSRPDMTFAVDWVLKINYLSVVYMKMEEQKEKKTRVDVSGERQPFSMKITRSDIYIYIYIYNY